MKDLVIFGSGGFGRETHQIVEDVNSEKKRWNFLGFVDDDPEICNKEIHGYPGLGGIDWLEKHPQVAVIVAVGHPKLRWKIVKRLEAINHKVFATLIHPRAWIANRVEIGLGTIIHASVNVTTDVILGNHVILNKNCTLGHDVHIDDFVFVAPHALVGSSEVGIGCYLGANCSTVNYGKLGHWSIVGAGAVVLKDLPANVTAVGVPAKIIETREEGWHST